MECCGTQTGNEIVDHESFGTPHGFKNTTEHEYGKHVEEKVREPLLREHVRDILVYFEIRGLRQVHAEYVHQI